MAELSKELAATIVKMANDNQSRITEDFATVQALIDSHDVVSAVWQDRSQPYGVDYIVIKGVEILAEVQASGMTRRARMSAILCINAEQAIALRMVAGDKSN
jgi:hypothetical protein